MLESYLSLTRAEREKIVFNDTYETLTKAVKTNSVVTFDILKSNGCHVSYKAYPFALNTSLEERHYYLQCYLPLSGTFFTPSLPKITSVFITNEKYATTLEIREKKKMAEKNTAHLAFNDTVSGYVEFTEAGLKKYHRILNNRPKLRKLSDTLYSFDDWDRWNIIEYFKRFGADAVITYPEDLKNEMRSYYNDAQRAYE